jgi:DNA-binding NtrC family response regulator
MSQKNHTQSLNNVLKSGRARIPEQSIVLVVEPRTMWRIFLKAVLTLYPYQVVAAATEQEAEAVRQEIGLANLGLVIADVHLSGDFQARGGVGLFERWTAMAPTLPFLLMSDDDNDANLPAIRAGTASFLTKPLIRHDILEAAALHLMMRAYPANDLT